MCRPTTSSKFRDEVKEEIRKKYTIVKECFSGADGIALYALPTAVFLPPPAPTLLDLRSKLCIIKIPKCACGAPALVEEIHLMRGLESSNYRVHAFHWGPDERPFIAMYRVLGPTLWEYLDQEDLLETPLPPVLVWSIVSDLLFGYLSLRGKEGRRGSVVHHDLHMNNLMIRTNFQVVMIDFGRAIVGPVHRADRRSQQYLAYKDTRANDLITIGKMLHDFAHDRFLDGDARDWQWVPLDNDGKCTCQRHQRPDERQPGPRAHFGSTDEVLRHILTRLSETNAMAVTDDEVVTLCASIATERAEANKLSSIKDLPQPQVPEGPSDDELKDVYRNWRHRKDVPGD